MADSSVTHRFSPFSNLIRLRRFDDYTLRTLQVILEGKEARLWPQFRSSFKEFLRSESLIAIRQHAHKPIHQVLSLLDFFIRAFTILSDVESCLALRYEALVTRESRAISHPELRVSCTEWMAFAENAFDNGFYSISSKACERALLHIDIKGNMRGDLLFANGAFINKIQSLQEVAIRLSASHAVQVRASEYMKRKNLCLKNFSFRDGAQYPASISFRNGIKQHNIRNLLRLRKSHQGQGA